MTETAHAYCSAQSCVGGRHGAVPSSSKRSMAGSPGREANTATAGPNVDAPPPIPPATGRLHAAWRERAQSRIIDLDLELDCLEWRLARGMSDFEQRLVYEAKRRLAVASEIVQRRPSAWFAWTGVDVEGAWANIHA